MSFIYHTLFFDPMYNVLVLLSQIIPRADVGIVVVLLTVIVRFIIYPLSKKAVLTQIQMSAIAPELEEIKEKYKDNKEEQARKTLAMYKEKKVNPFSGILVIIIQIPIIIALYQIFLKAGFPTIDTTVLYSFITAPEYINPFFFGVDITQKSVILALLAAVTTFLQFYISMRHQKKPTGNTFADNLNRSMQMQMKYFFPVIVFFIAYSISGVIALYWLTTNTFSIFQEIYIRKRFKTVDSRQ